MKQFKGKMDDKIHVAGEKTKETGKNLWLDIIIPGFKRVVVDTVKNGIDMIMWGTTSNRNNSNGGSIPYNSMYNSGNKYNSVSTTNNTSNNKSFEFRNYIFNDAGLTQDEIQSGVTARSKAISTLDKLRTNCQKYGSVSVYEFYQETNSYKDWTHKRFGWYNLDNASIARYGDGWIINFPPVESMTSI